MNKNMAMTWLVSYIITSGEQRFLFFVVHLQKYGILIKQSSLDFKFHSQVDHPSNTSWKMVDKIVKPGEQSRKPGIFLGKPEHLSFHPNTHIKGFLASKTKIVKRGLFSGRFFSLGGSQKDSGYDAPTSSRWFSHGFCVPISMATWKFTTLNSAVCQVTPAISL